MPRAFEVDWQKAKWIVKKEYVDVDVGSDQFWKLVQAIYQQRIRTVTTEHARRAHDLLSAILESANGP